MPLSGTSGEVDLYQNMELRQSVQSMPLKTVTNSSSSATAGSCTLNAAAGKITSETMSLAGATEYVLTLTNSLVTTADLVFAQLENGTNTTTPGPQISSVTPGAGFATFRIVNENVTQAVNGTVKVSFFVIKQTTFPTP